LSLRIRSCELKEANSFVANLHRHHKPCTGHRFSVRVVDDSGDTRGVAIVGRPVARNTDYRRVLEVTRLCTDGTKNACSILYAAAARAGSAMGYEKIQTFILDSEPATSVRAAGWRLEGVTNGGEWGRRNRARSNDQPTCPKQRWVKDL
jgi:hypothetical protein